MLGVLDDAVRVVDFHEVDAVAVLPTPGLDATALRHLGRDLERAGAELLVAPALREAAGPWAALRPAYGLPLLHAERLELRGARRLVQGAFDRGGALAALLLARYVQNRSPALDLLILGRALRAVRRGRDRTVT